MSRLKEHELYIALKCYELFEVNFLELPIGKHSLRVNPDNLEILKACPNPVSVTEIRRFLGAFASLLQVHS